MSPRYPNVCVRLRSDHPLAVVSAVRHALRRSGVDRAEIRRFTDQALAEAVPEHDPERVSTVCAAWARVVLERPIS